MDYGKGQSLDFQHAALFQPDPVGEFRRASAAFQPEIGGKTEIFRSFLFRRVVEAGRKGSLHSGIEAALVLNPHHETAGRRPDGTVGKRNGELLHLFVVENHPLLRVIARWKRDGITVDRDVRSARRDLELQKERLSRQFGGNGKYPFVMKFVLSRRGKRLAELRPQIRPFPDHRSRLVDKADLPGGTQ